MRPTALCFVFLIAASGCGPRERKVTMNSDNNSGQSGFAVLTDVGGSMTVRVETNTPEFVERTQNMHIHTGNCGEVDPIVAPLNNPESLEDKPGRVGSTTTEVVRIGGGPLLQFEELLEGEWLINIHDARDKDIYVSCGELQNN